MRKTIFLAAIFFASCLGYSSSAQVSVHFNLGLQPLWGPTGYDYASYYYIPDIDAYYDVGSQSYVYFDGGRWITSVALPPRYHDFDLYRVHKVVINEPTPWLKHDYYRNQYARYRGHNDQRVIRDSRDQKYWANPAHPQHARWHGENGYGHEKSSDWGGNRGNSKGQRHEDRGGRGNEDRGGHGNGHGNHRGKD